VRFSICISQTVLEAMSFSWTGLAGPTRRDAANDGVLGSAAQLLYFLLALVPAPLFVLAVGSDYGDQGDERRRTERRKPR
jgi:hypothetical protein